MKSCAIGVTGGIGCGKTTVCDLFAARGASIIDTDLIAHSLTAPHGPAMDAIRTGFGDDFITPAGALNRAFMRELVFRDPAAKVRLEAILHPMIREQTAQAAAAASAAGAPYLMFVVPLLIESGSWRERVDRILVIDCPETLQIARVMSRSGLTREQVAAIMATQVPRAVRLAHADDVIDNQGDLATLAAQVERLHRQYLTLAAQKTGVAG